jgi:diguanylate cyclase (GGDEF)-like protein
MHTPSRFQHVQRQTYGLTAALALPLLAVSLLLLWPDAVTGTWRQVLGMAVLLLGAGLAGLVLRLLRQLTAAHHAQAKAHQRLLDAIDALPAGFELYDADDRLVLTNTLARTMYPLIADLPARRPTFEEVVRAHHARGGLSMDADALEAWIARRKLQRRAGQEPHLMPLADGRWVRVNERVTREGGVVGVRVDVTEVMQHSAAADAARQEAESARMRLEDALEALPDGFAMFDAEDRLVLCNQRYRELYRTSGDAIRPGVRFEDMLHAGLARGQYPQAAGREEDWLAERIAAHRSPSGPVLQELPGNRWLRIDERRTREGGVAGVRADVTELVQRGQALQRLNEQLDAMNEELRTLSHTDPLTGLANRRLLEQCLLTEVARAHRHGLPLALLALDVDHFKRFNDHYGHLAGDDALVQVAAALQAQARRPADLAARTGGEEFALLLPHTRPDEAREMAQQLLQAVDALALPHAASGVSPCVSVSIGVATLTAGEPVRDLMLRADEALYAAKTTGRHRVAVSA